MKDWAANLWVFCITVLICLVVTEVVLTMMTPAQVPASESVWEKSDDSRLYKHKANFEREHMGVLIQTNSEGLRGDKEYGVKNGTRVLMLGDSVTAGFHVDFEDTFSEVVGREMGVEVLNLGVNGYDTKTEVESLKVSNYDPDVVVLNFVMNDAELSATPYSYFYSREFTECYLPYVGVQVSCEFKDFLARRHLVRFVVDSMKNIMFKTTEDYYHLTWAKEDLIEENVVKPLREFKEICDEEELECHVVVFPLLEWEEEYAWQDIEEQVNGILDEVGLEHTSLLDMYMEHDAGSLHVGENDILHLNKKGHELAGEYISYYLTT